MPEHTHTGRVPKPECDCRECFEDRIAAVQGVERIDAGLGVTRDSVRVTHHTDPKRAALYPTRYV